MNPIELIKKDLQNKKDTFGRPMIDTIVVLKKDDKGYYIEYAFKEGAPHDNRCLSWYDSYQPEAYRRNGWFKNLSEEDAKKSLDVIREEREKKIGKIYRLSSFSCGFEEDEKKFYDFGFFLRQDKEDGFYVTGTKNANSGGIVWIKS